MTPELNALIMDYIDDFNRKQGLPYVVKPSIPIVWFGDMVAYMQSEKKVVSVALNPSRKEFPANPRFNMDVLQALDAVNSLEKTLNGYFKRNPYGWFNHFENAISAFGASYYEDRAENIALHIDIYSAIATDPRWGDLNKEQQQKLARIDLFKKLFELLNPDVTLVSVGQDVFNEVFLPRFQLMRSAEKIGGKVGTFIKKYCRENQILISGSNYRGTPFGRMTHEVVKRTIQKMVGIESNPLGIGVSSCAMGNEENMTLKESLKGNKVNSENIAFWKAFKKWCLENGRRWCTADIATRGNPYYAPQGCGECHIFFTLGERSGETKGCGPLVTIGLYCAKGEEERSQIRKFRDDFEKQFSSCKFFSQDWESGTGAAKRILFVRQADYRNPSENLFKRMADDYEGILTVMRAHGYSLPVKKWK